jgi:hypothetical protein
MLHFDDFDFSMYDKRRIVFILVHRLHTLARVSIFSFQSSTCETSLIYKPFSATLRFLLKKTPDVVVRNRLLDRFRGGFSAGSAYSSKTRGNLRIGD